jgi:hypothetical protein
MSSTARARGVFTILILAALATLQAQDPPPPTVRMVPADLEDTAWLTAARDRQIAAAAGASAFHGFAFTDQLARSGITFQHRVVEDAARGYKAVHYDHGTGVSIADVDGDGRLDIYFVNQAGGSELWRNAGGGRFENITAAAGVGIGDKVSVAASFADIDNDGDADLFVTTVRGGNVLFENQGGGRFRDITAAAGVGYAGHSSGAVFFDYDRDGRLDLFVANVGRYTTDVRAGAFPYYLGFVDAFSGHLMPERSERSIPTATKAAIASRTSRTPRGWSTPHGRATPRRWMPTRTAGRTSTCSTCRATTSTTRTRAGSASSGRAAICSHARPGARWAPRCST